MVTHHAKNIRQVGDLLADQSFAYLKDHPEVYRELQKLQFNKELIELKNQDPFSKLVDDVHLPEWVNAASLERGGLFFRRHAFEIFGILGLYSLPYCYAGANGVQVLFHSRRIRTEPAKRLMETAQFVLEVCEPGGFTPNGKGLVSILKVRLMHAAARHYSRKVITHEEPVNQEDLLGTMLSFSLIVIRGLRKLGIQVSEQSMEDYFHMWYVIGRMLGIEEQWLPTSIRKASQLERQIRKREFQYTPEAEELTRVLIHYINGERNQTGIPVDANRLMAFFLGNEVSKCLGVKPLSMVEQNLFETGSRLRFAFKSFTADNFQQLSREFNQNLGEQNIKPSYKISF